jgi:hypothetical protein
MLRLEGEVNGRKVVRDCETAESATWTAAVLLDVCAINELRLGMILRSLHTAALAGRTWGWSAMEFALTLHGDQD